MDTADGVWAAFPFGSKALVIGLVLGFFAFIAGILVLLRWAKLIIPKGKLMDEAYVKASIRNYRRLLIAARIILVAGLLALVAMGLLHWQGVITVLPRNFEAVFTHPGEIVLLVVFLLTFFAALLVFSPRRGKFFNSEKDWAGEIYAKQQRRRYREQVQKLHQAQGAWYEDDSGPGL